MSSVKCLTNESNGIDLQAPVGVMTVCIRGKVKLRTPATPDIVRRILIDLRFRTPTKNVVNAHGPSHSLLSLNGREYFSGVLESYWSLPQGIAHCKQVDKSSQALVKYIKGTSEQTYRTTGPICDARVPGSFRRERPPANRKMNMRGKVFVEASVSQILSQGAM